MTKNDKTLPSQKPTNKPNPDKSITHFNWFARFESAQSTNKAG